MENNTDQDLKQLESYVDELIVICEHLKKKIKRYARKNKLILQNVPAC